MIKLVSNSVLSLYDSVYTNNDWLIKYEYNEAWSSKIKNIIDAYLIANQCVLYGSKSVELTIQSKRNNNMFKLKTGDYDVYSPRPKQQMIELYELLKKENFVWSARCVFARHHGTSTLYVNDNKIIDFTYMDQHTLDILPTFKTIQGIKCVSHLISISSYFSVLSDPESVYMIPKTTEKLNLLCSEFPFKFSVDQLQSGNIFNNSKKCRFIAQFTKCLEDLEALNNISPDQIPKYSQLIKSEKQFSLHKHASLKPRRASVDAEHESDTNFIEIINESTNLPSFYRYAKPSNEKYFYTGSIAAYTFISAFGDNINLGKESLSKDTLISCIFDEDIEVYVENLDIAVYNISQNFKDSAQIECSMPILTEYRCMFSRAIKLKFQEIGQTVYMYELSNQRFAEIVNVKFPHGRNISNIKCSSYMFLMSHLLLKMALFGKSKYTQYSNLITVLSSLSNRNQSHPIFRPSHFSPIYIVGNRQAILRTNENFDSVDSTNNGVSSSRSSEKAMGSVETRKSEYHDGIKININYDLLI